MKKNLQQLILDYKKVLQKDPQSRSFAPLAQALFENGQVKESEQIATAGIKKNPEYVGGYVSLGKILLSQNKLLEAKPILQKACELDPQNLLALHLYATLLLQKNQPKESLKIFKRILFLNPQSEKARSAIQKLESLSADEFEDDVFQYQSLKNLEPIANESKLGATSSDLSKNSAERQISLIDALIARGEIEKAKILLSQIPQVLKGHSDIKRRIEIINETRFQEEPSPIRPVQSRENLVIERKKQILESLLLKVNNLREKEIVQIP